MNELNRQKQLQSAKEQSDRNRAKQDSTLKTQTRSQKALSKSTISFADKLNDYILPIASTTTLGAIKVGANLTIDVNGILNASGGAGATDWGLIGGNIADQLDLQAALALKSNTIHNLIDTTNHPVSGLTTGHFLKATSATTYAFDALSSAEILAAISDMFVLEGVAPNQYIRCLYPFASDFEIQAFTNGGWLPASWWDSLPVAKSITYTPALSGYLELVGDELTPADGKFYGKVGGVKGWYTPTGGVATYPGVGLAKSTGSAWDTSVTDNSTNWNTAYSHTLLTNNPHSVTATQVGLGNVTNESKATMFSNPVFTGQISYSASSNGTSVSPVSTNIFYGVGNATNNGITHLNSWNSDHASWWEFYVENTAGAKINALTLYHNGNVGIGTTSPNATLDVRGNIVRSSTTWATGEGFQIQYQPDPTHFYLGISLDAANRGMNFHSIMANGNTGFHFITGTAASNSEKMCILDNGNVGIGTTSSNNKLQIGSGANQQYGILVESYYTSGYAQYVGNWPSSGRWGIGYNSGSADLTVKIGRVSDTIGSWTTGDFYLLVAGNVSATGEVTAYYSSDRYLKHNIRQFSALDKIDMMNPVAFQWNAKAKELNNSKDDRTNYGFIAQEVEAIMPELVHSIYGEYKSLDYTQIIPILTQAIKELREEVKSLKHNQNDNTKR